MKLKSAPYTSPSDKLKQLRVKFDFLKNYRIQNYNNRSAFNSN